MTQQVAVEAISLSRQGAVVAADNAAATSRIWLSAAGQDFGRRPACFAESEEAVHRLDGSLVPPWERCSDAPLPYIKQSFVCN
jgi:hypothetical protein